MLNYLNKLVSRLLYIPCHHLLEPWRNADGRTGGFFSSTLHLKSGWYMIECQLKEAQTLNFFFIGFKGKMIFDLPVRSESMAKRIIFLPNPIFSIRISLNSHMNSSHIQYLRFVPLRRAFALQRILKRLRTNEAEILRLAKRNNHSFETFLFSAYDSLFSTDRDTHYQQWIMQLESERMHAHKVTDESTPMKSDDSEYMLFCAPHYEAAPEARRLMIIALKNNQEAQLVYTDEDIKDHVGRRSNPHFKSDWNPDLFLSHDYISSFYMCRRSWYLANQEVFEAHGERLALTRILPLMKAEAILHLPLVLAHTDKNQQVSSVSYSKRVALLKKVLPQSTKISKGLLPGTYRIQYALPKSPPMISLLIPSRDALPILRPCVESILHKTTYPNFEILILDNQSEQLDTLNWFNEVQKDSRVKVVQYNHSFNYSAINNFGVQHAKGSIIGLINNDVEVISSEWLSEMASHVLRPEIGCVGAKLYYGNGKIQHGGVILGLGDVAGHAHRYLQRHEYGYQGRLKLVQNYSAVTAACLLVKREVYEKIRGLKEEQLAVAYNDVDFCLRVQELGYRNLWTPYAELYHHESISRGQDNTTIKKERYAKEVAYMQSTWGEQLTNDPYYNPNLSRKREDFSFREF